MERTEALGVKVGKSFGNIKHLALLKYCDSRSQQKRGDWEGTLEVLSIKAKKDMFGHGIMWGGQMSEWIGSVANQVEQANQEVPIHSTGDLNINLQLDGRLGFISKQDTEQPSKFMRIHWLGMGCKGF